MSTARREYWEDLLLTARRPTALEIEAARTPAGGWTRAQLAAWGVPWPPPKGWKAALLRGRS